jgi:hypothetical protein
VSRGPLWATDTTRGTGPSTTELERVGQRYVNKYGVMNGPNAQRGLYVGTIRVGASGVSDSQTFRHVWNAYNRVQRHMFVVDAASTWNYTLAAIRQANGNAANQLDFVMGLIEDPIWAEVRSSASNTVGATFQVGIGINTGTITYAPNQIRNFGYSAGAGHYATASAVLHRLPFSIGRYPLIWLEQSEAVIASTTSWLAGSSDPSSGIFGYLMA